MIERSNRDLGDGQVLLFLSKIRVQTAAVAVNPIRLRDGAPLENPGTTVRVHLPRIASLLLSLFLAAIPACSTVPREAPPVQPTSWNCNEEADRALAQGDVETGIRLHQRLLETQPDNALAIYHLGYAYGQMGDHDREIACYERAWELGLENDELLFNLGMAYGETGRTGKAVQALRKAVKAAPRKADYRVGLGLALESKGDLGPAARAFQQAVRLDPSLTDARLFLARVYIQTGQTGPAREQLLEILQLDPYHPGARRLLQGLETPG